MSKNDSVQNTNSVPIKVVQKHPSDFNKVVKGAGICAAKVAVPHKYIKNTEELPPQVWRRTLLDSGQDGDLLLITERQMKIIPYEKRYAANNLQTLNGTFKTSHVDNFKKDDASSIFQV